jgi:hypothetical protein
MRTVKECFELGGANQFRVIQRNCRLTRTAAMYGPNVVGKKPCTPPSPKGKSWLGGAAALRGTGVADEDIMRHTISKLVIAISGLRFLVLRNLKAGIRNGKR